MGKTVKARRTTALRELAVTMKELGLTSATLADGTSATLAVVPRAVFETPVRVATPRLSCACKHPMSRHNKEGECIQPECRGPCKITETTTGDE
jgi:hypothetical protein